MRVHHPPTCKHLDPHVELLLHMATPGLIDTTLAWASQLEATVGFT